MPTANQYALAHAVLRGEKPWEAYQRIYGCSERSARSAVSRALGTRAMQHLLEELRQPMLTETEDIRRELAASMLRDMRDDGLPAAARSIARKQLMELYGLDEQRLVINADEAFRLALIRGAEEPLVRD